MDLFREVYFGPRHQGQMKRGILHEIEAESRAGAQRTYVNSQRYQEQAISVNSYTSRMPSGLINLAQMDEGEANMFLISKRQTIGFPNPLPLSNYPDITAEKLKRALRSIAYAAIRFSSLKLLKWLYELDKRSIPNGLMVGKRLGDTSVKVIRWLFQHGKIDAEVFSYVNYRADILSEMTDLLVRASPGEWYKVLGANCNSLRDLRTVFPKCSTEDKENVIRGVILSENMVLLREFVKHEHIAFALKELAMSYSDEGLELARDSLLALSEPRFNTLLRKSVYAGGLIPIAYLLENNPHTTPDVWHVTLGSAALDRSIEVAKLVFGHLIRQGSVSVETLVKIWNNVAHVTNKPWQAGFLVGEGLCKPVCFTSIVYCITREAAECVWSALVSKLGVPKPEQLQNALDSLPTRGCIHATGVKFLVEKGAKWDTRHSVSLVESNIDTKIVADILLELNAGVGECLTHIAALDTARARNLYRRLIKGERIPPKIAHGDYSYEW